MTALTAHAADGPWAEECCTTELHFPIVLLRTLERVMLRTLERVELSSWKLPRASLSSESSTVDRSLDSLFMAFMFVCEMRCVTVSGANCFMWLDLRLLDTSRSVGFVGPHVLLRLYKHLKDNFG